MAPRQLPSNESRRGAISAVILNIMYMCTSSKSKDKKSSDYVGDSSSSPDAGTDLQKAAEIVSKEFEFTKEEMRLAVKGFIRQLNDGLQTSGTAIEQLPSFITLVPTGFEKGVYLAVDLGGTNLRVCLITLNGDGTHSMAQSRTSIPSLFMVSKKANALFGFIALRIESFLESHDINSGTTGESNIGLGFTFSHAVSQIAIDSGILLRWSKGFDIEEAIGQNICALLQNELDKLNLPVRVTALVNDTVGTLMARAYASPRSAHTIMGAVFGTGTNGAYVENASRILKISSLVGPTNGDGSPEKLMVVNTEWGNFDQQLKFLPNTSYDKAIDIGGVNPGFELFEKRISGMYLGEILRLAVMGLVNDPLVSIFSNSVIHQNSKLYAQWGIDSEIMSALEDDKDEGLTSSIYQIETRMGITNVSWGDARAVKTISHSIGRRSARLGAVALAAVILQTGSLKNSLKTSSKVDIGVDGSLIEMYPGFVEEIRGALRDIEEIGSEGDSRINIAMAKDGSGVGAALAAHIAMKWSSRKDI